jgi:hypothetical protein
VVTNEQLYIMITIPMLSNAVVTLLGIVFLEIRSDARERQSNEVRERRRIERLRRG